MEPQQLEERISRLESIIFQESRKISEDKIETLVDEILSDPDKNTFIPDVIEREFYFKIINLVLKSLEKTLESTKIEILNHKIEFKLTDE